jgi:hypothetical protein
MVSREAWAATLSRSPALANMTRTYVSASGEHFVRADASDREIFEQTLLANSPMGDSAVRSAVASRLANQEYGRGPSTLLDHALERARTTTESVTLDPSWFGNGLPRVIQQGPVTDATLQRGFFTNAWPDGQLEVLEQRLHPKESGMTGVRG